MPLLALPFPVIDPVLVHLGPLAIRWYALAYIAGLIVGWCADPPRSSPTIAIGAARRGRRADSIDDLLVYCALGVVIGGRLGNVLFYDPGYYFAHPLEIFMVWQGGMAFHGGMLGALVGVLLFARRYRDAVADGARSRLPRRADRHLPRPHRQFHQAGALGPADRRALGDDLSRLRRRCRAIPARSTRRLLEGLANFVVAVARSRAAAACGGRGCVTGAFGVDLRRWRASSASSFAIPIPISRTSAAA